MEPATNATTQDNATRREAAIYLCLSEDTLRRWECQGKGPEMVRISPRKALYPWASLRAFLKAKLTIPGQGAGPHTERP
jgi:hypothetical protein